MSNPRKTLTILKTRLDLHKSRIALVFLLVALMVSVSAVIAQEGESGVDAPVREPILLSETKLPYGVQTTIRIFTSKDAQISSLHANTNYGGWSTMALGYSSGIFNASRTLLEYNISAIPSQAIINSAFAAVYQESVTPPGDPNTMDFRAQYMKSQWSESTVTWNNANYLGGDEIGIGSFNSALGWKQGDITSLIQAWHSGARPNYGMIWTGDERTQPPEGNRSRTLRTKEFGGFSPYVDVTYTSCSDVTPPTATVNPLPNWSGDEFKVSWSGTDSGAGIAWYDVQYRINNGGWVNWKTQTTSTSATYKGASNGQFIEFRARATDNCGNQQSWGNPQAWTNIDTVAPTASVNPLPQFTLTPNFIVTWSGTDNASGINNYDVQARIDGGDWIDWQEGTTNTSAQVTGAQNGSLYEFRARATDNVGNTQGWSSGAQAQTFVAFQPVAWVLPFSPNTTDQTTFTVEWTGLTAPGTTITDYKVYYRFNGGIWNLWQNNTASTSEVFTANEGDGMYEFSATARNSLGQEETFTGVPEAAMLVNEAGQFSFTYMPAVFN